MTNILLIDLSSLAHPLFHISASDPDPNATSTKTVERVRALASGQPHVAICAEGGRSFRKDVSPDYKANRPESDAALQHQIALALDILKADGFPVWSVKGMEADDIIGSSVHRALERQDVQVTIATADKDLLPLVSDRVTVKSLRDGALLGPADVRAKFGVPPSAMPDYLALCGDTADNIKGANGIGPKRAAELLNKYTSIENLYTQLTQHGTQFTPVLATSLREFQLRLPVVRELLALRTDVPIPFDEIWKERVPADVEVFGDEDPLMADIRDAMPTLSPEQLFSVQASAVQGLVNPVAAPSGAPQTRIDESAALPPPQPARGPVQDAQEAAILASSAERARQMPPPARQEAPSAANNGGDEAKPAKAPAPVLTPPSQPEPMERVELIPAPADFERQLEPRSYAEAKLAALDMFAARIFSQWGNAAAMLAIIMSGREFGIPMMASLRAFDNIDGKPAMKADLIRALVLKSGKVEYFDVISRSEKESTWAIKRNGRPEVRLTYTIDEAKAAWIKGDNAWKASGYGRNPADMLVARASSKLARLVCPDVTHGLYCGEELD